MYSVKEKLNHFRQLSSPSAAEADLALLREKSPGNSNLIRYGLASSKNAEDILFDLLDVVTHDEIVRNRREFLAAQEAEEVEQPKEETPTETTEEAEQVTVPEEAPAPEAEEVEQPKEEATTEAAEEAEQPETEKKSTSPKKKSTKK
ncbi:MAG: hypothetical protein HXN55_03660 [Prevotella nigrescens]|uniref:Uncharacterized protein n=1 Tax=Prevotella nigrescens TaxID=28133 RepID=A0A9D5WUG7_9BACT|nr:hypothetical protein [Prevotella nigrescens]MBF1446474.1 hypothetical protein [Prevotella nigrescens]DAK34892.1 MAG TPA: hypothetical protein [Caudoviricetes sp.]DAS13847.1 MAG TPA: hypothetical protein [Caudoviricetes sp.]